jgi:poly(3-hydroxyalkanoate) synthetase
MYVLSTMATTKGNKRVYLTWTDGMDATLLAVLVEHHNNGDHAQNGWKAHVYNAAIKNVCEKCGGKYIKLIHICVCIL